MALSNLKNRIAELPDTPGVYFFRGEMDEILYIGKATSLKNRVQSYLSNDLIISRGERIVKMTQEIESVTFEKTDSVLEALVLEAHLIKKHRPKYNVLEKDDKSYNFVVITKEPSPRVLIKRGRDILSGKIDFKIAKSFGPFTQGKNLKEGVKIIRKIFPFRDKCIPEKNGRPCFNYQIGLCPGMCAGKISEKEYKKHIRHIVLFFEGKKKKLLSVLNSEMKKSAKALDFENAEKIKRQVFALNHINDVSLISEDLLVKAGASGYRIEGYDIAHMGGKDLVGVMTVIENGEVQKNEYRKFKIKGGTGNNDTAALKEVLERRLAHDEWPYPKLIVIDGGLAQINIAKKVIADNGFAIPIVSVVKNEFHKAKDILGDKKHISENESSILLVNSEAHRFAIAFHRKNRNSSFL